MIETDYITKLDLTLRMDMMSLRILCKARLKRMHHCQFAGKYAQDYKKALLKCWRAFRGIV